MGQVSRRAFLREFASAVAVDPLPAADHLFERYANKVLPTGLAKTTATLTPYNGAWTETEVIHLLRRTSFGVKPADVQTLLGMTMNGAVDYLFSNAPATPPAPPVNNYNTGSYTDPTGITPGQPWVNAPYGDSILDDKRQKSLKSWWMGLILNQNLSILEKMVFFWHNHFATEISFINNARQSYNHHAMLRANALGNFKTLVRNVTLDPAMLKYLNGYLNTRTAPDENYGRELMELFTLSKYNNPNYTENDVKAAARVLTGWRIDTTNNTSYFDPSRHDTGNKQFSAFFNNAVISYQPGAAGAGETDQLIDLLFARVETANYICTKLYRYFVYYLVDATVQANIIDPLAQLLVSNNFNIVPVLKQLLKSQHFFDMNSRGCYIRTPLDYVAGTCRTFGVTLPAGFTVEQTYMMWSYLWTYSGTLGLDLGDPVNVAGYPAWYQTPQYYELWINSNTFPKRLQFMDPWLNNGVYAGTGVATKINVLSFAQQYPQAGDPDLLVAWCCRLLSGIDLSPSRLDTLKSILLSGQTTNYYWTSAWQAYLANPNAANTAIVKTRLTSLINEITRMAEHQLC